ncbi:hypothetical protein D0863_12415 [Hortaea werneckii]|uniref:Uncharacterized protein n=1 Tax=Hortaea werneckii TaxID=91943 RepID=A0A3M7D277_HORWE|nr:hypothetical protein D0863_12415 [Hortaea werneckii]
MGTIGRIWKCFGCGGGGLLGLSRVIVGSLDGDGKTWEIAGEGGVNDGGDDGVGSGGGGGGGRRRLGCEGGPTSLNYGALCDPDSANATALSLRSYSGSGAAIHLPDRVLNLKDWLDAHGGSPLPPPASVDVPLCAVVIQPFDSIKMRSYGYWPEERQRSGKPVKSYYLAIDYGRQLSIAHRVFVACKCSFMAQALASAPPPPWSWRSHEKAAAYTGQLTGFGTGCKKRIGMQPG